MGKNIKKRTRCNSPIKCWLSSDTSPLHPCDWLRLACGWERARGSAGQTWGVFQTGADVAIILSTGALIQSKSKHMLGVSGVWQMGHREQGWVSIMKPGGQTDRDTGRKWGATRMQLHTDGIDARASFSRLVARFQKMLLGRNNWRDEKNWSEPAPFKTSIKKHCTSLPHMASSCVLLSTTTTLAVTVNTE